MDNLTREPHHATSAHKEGVLDRRRKRGRLQLAFGSVCLGLGDRRADGGKACGGIVLERHQTGAEGKKRGARGGEGHGGRLKDSVLLTEGNRKRYRTLIADHIEEICVDIARHDDREALGELADLELLTADNIDSVIDAVNRLFDASTTGYLLELKRVRFDHSHNDYDL